MLLNLSASSLHISGLEIISSEKMSLLADGVSIAILGISVVFMGLVFLLIFMKMFNFVFQTLAKHQEKKKIGIEVNAKNSNEPVSGEIIAAIAYAIKNSREEFHDYEKTIITLQKIARPYSPWSSKIYGIRKVAR